MLQLHNQPSSGLWFSEGCAHITGIILGDTHLILGCNQITNHMKLFFLAAIKDGYEMTVSCQIRFQASTWATPSIASNSDSLPLLSVNASLRVLTFPILSTSASLWRGFDTRLPLLIHPQVSDAERMGLAGGSDRRRDVGVFFWLGRVPIFRCPYEFHGVPRFGIWNTTQKIWDQLGTVTVWGNSKFGGTPKSSEL